MILPIEAYGNQVLSKKCVDVVLYDVEKICGIRYNACIQWLLNSRTSDWQSE